MQEFYEKIMKKPKAYRKKLAYGITLFFGLLLFSLWMAMTMLNFKQFFGENSPQESLRKISPSLKEKYQKEAEVFEGKQEKLEELGY